MPECDVAMSHSGKYVSLHLNICNITITMYCDVEH